MIRLTNLTVGYGQRRLIADASCTIECGELVTLIGRNGSGKSSLLRVIAGLDSPQQGSVAVNNHDLHRMSPRQKARTIAFVTTHRVRIANMRCADVVGMGRAPYTDWIGRLGPADRLIVDQSLEMVGMTDYADRTLDKMSDGECQRIMIARALAQDTPVILLDEPTSFLDLPNRYELCLLLKRLAQQRRKCIIFSTHELDIAMQLCNRVMLIDTPQLIEGTPTDKAVTDSIGRLFSTINAHLDPLTGRVTLK